MPAFSLAAAFGSKCEESDGSNGSGEAKSIGTLTSWQILAEQMDDGQDDSFSEDEEATALSNKQHERVKTITGKNLGASAGGIHLDLRSPSFVSPLPTLSGIFGLDEAPSSFVAPKQLHVLYKEYRLLNEIGSGAFGRVCKARRLRDGKEVVVKEIRTVNLSGKMKAATMDEVQVLAKMNHPNIVRYHDCFMDESYIDIVMEYCSAGDIGKLVKSRTAAKQPLSEEEIMFLFVQICLALQYTHAAGVLHRDLKTSNCMLLTPSPVSGQANTSMQGHASGIGSPLVKLGDFGVAKVTGGEAGSICNTVVGTPQYLPPEMLESKPYGRRSDVWALGCILYELCTLKRAFESDKIPMIYCKITQGTYDPLPQSCSQDIKDLVQQLLSKDPQARPTVLEVLQIPYVRIHLCLYLEWARNITEAHPEVLLKSLGESWTRSVSNHMALKQTSTAAGLHAAAPKSPAIPAQHGVVGHSRLSCSSTADGIRPYVPESPASRFATSPGLKAVPANSSPIGAAAPHGASAATSRHVSSLEMESRGYQVSSSEANSSHNSSGSHATVRSETCLVPGDPLPSSSVKESRDRYVVPAPATTQNLQSPFAVASGTSTSCSKPDSSSVVGPQTVALSAAKSNQRRSSLVIDAAIIAQKLQETGLYGAVERSCQSMTAAAARSTSGASVDPRSRSFSSHQRVPLEAPSSLQAEAACSSHSQTQCSFAQQQQVVQAEQQTVTEADSTHRKPSPLLTKIDNTTNSSRRVSGSSLIADVHVAHETESGKLLQLSRGTSTPQCRSRSLNDLESSREGTAESITGNFRSLEEWLEGDMNLAALWVPQQQQEQEDKAAAHAGAACGVGGDSVSNGTQYIKISSNSSSSSQVAVDANVRVVETAGSVSNGCEAMLLLTGGQDAQQPELCHGGYLATSADGVESCQLPPAWHSTNHKSPKQLGQAAVLQQTEQRQLGVNSTTVLEPVSPSAGVMCKISCSLPAHSGVGVGGIDDLKALQQQHAATAEKLKELLHQAAGRVGHHDRNDSFADSCSPNIDPPRQPGKQLTRLKLRVETEAKQIQASSTTAAPMSDVGRWIASLRTDPSLDVDSKPSSQAASSNSSSMSNAQEPGSRGSTFSNCAANGYVRKESRLGGSLHSDSQSAHPSGPNVVLVHTVSDPKSDISSMTSEAAALAAALEDSTTNSMQQVDAARRSAKTALKGQDALVAEQREVLSKFRAFKAKLLMSASTVAPAVPAGLRSPAVSSPGSTSLPGSPRSSSRAAGGSSLFNTRWGPHCI